MAEYIELPLVSNSKILLLQYIEPPSYFLSQLDRGFKMLWPRYIGPPSPAFQLNPLIISNSNWRGGSKYHGRDILPPPLLIRNSNEREGSKYYGGDIFNPIHFAILIRDGVKNIMAAIIILNPRLLFNCFQRGGSKYSIYWTPSYFKFQLERRFKILWPNYITTPFCFSIPIVIS